MANAAVALSDIEDGLFFASMGGYGEAQAYLCRATGHMYYQSDLADDLEELPDDIDEDDKYVALPDKRDLDLGRKLVDRFALEHLSDDYDKVRAIFSHRGAYARFKDLLDHHDKLQLWYDYEEQATREALRQWCEDNDIPLKD